MFKNLFKRGDVDWKRDGPGCAVTALALAGGILTAVGGIVYGIAAALS